MSPDNRGQLSTNHGMPFVTMIVAGIAGYVGLQVMEKVSEGHSPEDVEVLCQGVAGCGSTPATLEVLVLGVGISIAAVAIGFILRLWKARGAGTGTEPSSRLQVVKEQYVEGDIDTVLTLEDRLEDVLDDEPEEKDE